MDIGSKIKRVLEVVDGEICIPGAGIWLDPRRKKDLAFISHAHSDHAVKHRKVITSRSGLPLYRHRVGDVEIEAREYGRPFPLGDAEFTLLPAGHILGSAQVLVVREGVSLLYSGDFKLRSCATAEKIEPRRADILIVESTYGVPHYKFPPRDEVIALLRRFLEEAVAAQRTPVLLAYSLGKAQETMRIVSDLGYESWVHEAIFPIAKIYEQEGVKLGRYHRLTPDDWRTAARNVSRPRVIIVPPHLRNAKGALRAVGPTRAAFLSGFALDSSAPFGYQVDTCIPLSDHADYEELVEYVRCVAPQVVFTTHGRDEFRRHLAAEGFRVLPLRPSA